MKKLFLSLVATMMAATATYAQSSLLATLSSNGTITTYYGADALRNAHADAKDDDIITLSSGSFTSIEVTKGITLRGAGMEVDATTGSEPTIIAGKFNIKIPEETTAKLTIEGIYFNEAIVVNKKLSGATILKSRLKNLTSSSLVENLTMIHCKVANQLYLSVSGSTLSCLNCIIWEPYYYNGGVYGEFTNCIVSKNAPGSYFGNATMKNCVLLCGNSYLGASNTLFNCVAVNTAGYNVFYNSTNSSNTVVKDYTSVFKTCKDNTYSDSENFELTSEAANNYKGTDGTQVGIYGGNMPFNPTPSNPRITKCDVASKSTADGKLSVDITVEGAE